MTGVVARTAWMVLLLVSVRVSGVETDAAEWLRFERISLEEGLSQLSIVAAHQDSRGFLWFGTQAGLNRYDGYEFKVYKRVYGRSEATLSDNYVRALAETDDGSLWIGTASGGLNRFDPRREELSVFRNDPSAATSLTNDQIRSLTVDARGRLWVGTAGGGLDRLEDADNGTFSHWAEDLPNAIVNALLVHEDHLWIGTATGLAVMDLETEEVRMVAAVRGFHVTALANDTEGRLWIGTQGGLLSYGLQDESLRSYRHNPDDPRSLAFNQVESLLIDADGVVWIGTTNGLSRYRPASDDFESYFHDVLDENSLSSNRISSMMQDRTGILWFGTWTGGVNKLNRSAITFRGYRGRANDPGSLDDSRVRGFYEDEKGIIWVATLGGGLSRFDPATEAFTNYHYVPGDQATIGSDELHAVVADDDGYLWLGTRNAGVSRFDPRTGVAWRFPHQQGNPQSPAGDHVLSLLVDDRNRLWVGTLDSGVSRLDIELGRWQHYRSSPEDPNSLSSDTVGYLFQSSDGVIWLGTRGAGFNLYRPETDDFLRVAPAPETEGGLVHGTVTFISEGEQGDLWLGTQGGGFGQIISRGERPQDFRFRFVNSADGLPSDAIGAVLHGDDGRIWVSTLVGINAYDPQTGAMDHFYPIHGTQRRAYYVGSGMVARDGALYFGGLDGITRFKPVEFPRDETPPRVVITELLISNRPVEVRAGSPLPLAAPYVREVELDYTRNIFGFEFAGLHFAEPEKNLYRYQLEGFDESWVQTSASRRHATYTNLDAGRYRFLVKAANRDGVWSEPVVVQLRILPAPWRTPWAYLLYALLLALIIATIAWVRYRQQATRRAAAKAVRESEERLKLALWGSGDEMWYLDLRTGRMQRLSYGRAMEIRTAKPINDLGTLLEIMHPDDREGIQAAMDRHIRGQTPSFESTYRVKGREGQWLWALSKGRVVERDDDGEAVIVAGATKDVTQLKNTERALRELNERLETMVDERTEDLQRANADLKKTLDMLTEAQTQLVESEKMASLGNLVAGVAHEINTPVGVALTAATYMDTQIRQFLEGPDGGEVSDAEAYRAFCNKEKKNIEFLIQNLNRAADLIKSFKQVAVDQSSEERRAFKVSGYLDEILTSLRPKFKGTDHEVTVTCDEQLEMESYPGALYQVMTNLVLNSLTHGFEHTDAGRISIRVESGNNWVSIRYRDNGRGFGPEVQARIFEPFYTTRRGAGGSGLGMHIVYNLVTQVLRGRIQCRGKPGEGVEIDIDLPRVVDQGAP